LYDLRHVTALRISHREKTGAIYQFDLAYQFGYAIWVLTKKNMSILVSLINMKCLYE